MKPILFKLYFPLSYLRHVRFVHTVTLYITQLNCFVKGRFIIITMTCSIKSLIMVFAACKKSGNILFNLW